MRPNNINFKQQLKNYTLSRWKGQEKNKVMSKKQDVQNQRKEKREMPTRFGVVGEGAEERRDATKLWVQEERKADSLLLFETI